MSIDRKLKFVLMRSAFYRGVPAIHPMQNEKGLGAIRARTRLVGPRKNGRLMRRAPNFK